MTTNMKIILTSLDEKEIVCLLALCADGKLRISLAKEGPFELLGVTGPLQGIPEEYWDKGISSCADLGLPDSDQAIRLIIEPFEDSWAIYTNLESDGDIYSKVLEDHEFDDLKALFRKGALNG